MSALALLVAAYALSAAAMARASGQSPDLGAISFSTSARKPETQQAFERGVLALHSFWRPVARQAFQEAQRLEPDFALAYWGEALSYAHPIWFDQDASEGRRVLARLGADSTERLAKTPTDRERAYLRAVEVLFASSDAEAGRRGYVRAMRRVVEAYPADDEAATLYAHALHTMLPVEQSAEEEWDRTIALLEGVFARNPRHPGAAHYLIHTYDDPKLAPRGLPAALAYARIAPASPHALHMPSHIFVQLGRWDDVVASNQAAWDASEAWVRSQGLPTDRRDYHALDWLSYGLLMQGRLRMAEGALSVFTSSARTSSSSALAAYVHKMGARIHVERQDWQVLSLPPRSKPDAPFGDGNALFAAGLSAAYLELPLAATARTLLDSLAALEGETAWGRAAAAMAREIDAVHLLRSGQAAAALAQLSEAAELEDRIGIPNGPPYVLKPVDELFGEVLLELGRPSEAAEHFTRSLDRTPRRPLSLLGRARALRATGDATGAARCYGALLAVWHAADPGFDAVAEARAFLDASPPGAGGGPCGR